MLHYDISIPTSISRLFLSAPMHIYTDMHMHLYISKYDKPFFNLET